MEPCGSSITSLKEESLSMISPEFTLYRHLEKGQPLQTKQLPHVAKVDRCDSWWCNLGQSLSNHGPHVFYGQKIRRSSRPGKQFNLVIDEEPFDNACHVWSHIILLKYGCGQALKVRKDNWLQYLGDVALAA
ncbi:uncharacterized protein TNCV_1847501 [Trichonephila clavipes]|nr:uncharacterized protein TNCV_1847501 [Trichonephila clavipes]